MGIMTPAGPHPAAAHPHPPEDAAWTALATATTESQFCEAWLAILCARMPHAQSGVVLSEQDDGSFIPAAVWPSARLDVSYLTSPVEQALAERRGVVAQDETKGLAAVVYPLEIDGRPRAVVALGLHPCADGVLQDTMRQIHWAAGLLESMFRRRLATEGQARADRALAALDLLAIAGEHERLDAAALAVASELAARMQCERVAIGFVEKDRIRVRALSNSATFERKSLVVAAIENAMDEAFDQHGTLAHPPVDGSTRIRVAHEDLARESGAAAILSVMLMANGREIGVITAERGKGAAFDVHAAQLLEGAGHLLGPLMFHKLTEERWVGGKAARLAGDGVRAVFGPRHAGAKAGAIAALLVIAFLSLATGDYRVSAKANIEGAVQRALAAPFESFIRTAPVRAGAEVTPGQVLATLDDRDLLLEREKIDSEREQAMRKYRDAIARHERTEASIAGAELAQAEAQLALVEEKLARTRITAPFHGIVVSGDLSQMLGSPVEQGKVLFEVAPLDAYRAVLQVDERDIIHVRAGQRGALVLSGKAGERLPFTVKQVTPVSTQKEGENSFRVEAQLDDASALLRPGMEGIGKVEIGERKLLWIWTRRLVDWMRLTLWRWTP